MPDLYELEEIAQPPIPSISAPSGTLDTSQEIHVLPTPGPAGQAGVPQDLVDLVDEIDARTALGGVTPLQWYNNGKA